MEKKDLMIGDWVANDLNEIQRVEEIREEGIMLAYNDFYTEDELEPIPLTIDILKKNFPFIDGLAWWPQDDAFHCETRTDGDIMVSGQFRFVHQLQHALRLAGVDKEIVL